VRCVPEETLLYEELFRNCYGCICVVLQARIDRQKRQSIAETNEMVMRRSMEIFALLQEQHKQKEKEAEEGVKKLTREWEEQGPYGVKVKVAMLGLGLGLGLLMYSPWGQGH
jgi:hypothetical protein